MLHAAAHGGAARPAALDEEILEHDPGKSLRALPNEEILAKLTFYTDCVERERYIKKERAETLVRRSVLFGCCAEHWLSLLDAKRARELNPQLAVACFREGVAHSVQESPSRTFGQFLLRIASEIVFCRPYDARRGALAARTPEIPDFLGHRSRPTSWATTSRPWAPSPTASGSAPRPRTSSARTRRR